MKLQQKLLQWFKRNKRPLPWRKHYRPYDVWVSEIMLQQTQMNTMLPYFRRWMKSFPTLQVLANAESRQVLKAWEGLGYYSRARNIHESAKEIVKRHGGEFPRDFELIRSLKGVGRYSAGAIASIAFNENRPIVDGNILRVLSRMYAISKPIDVEKNREHFWKLQEDLIPHGQARDFNQALMELGALLCTSQNPACGLCPLQNHCRAFIHGTQESYPVKAHKKKMVTVIAAAVVLKNKGKYLLRYRPVGEIMGGLWEFPEWKLSKNKPLSYQQVLNKIQKITRREISLDLENLTYLGKIKRNYTNHLETMNVFSAEFSGETKSEKGLKTAWAAEKDFSNYPFSSAHSKIANLLASFAETE